MRHIFGPILALFGILAIIGVAIGLAYTAGLNAAAVTTVTAATAAGTTTVVPVVAYGWGGMPWFGFGQFLFILVGFFLIVALLRAAFGSGRRHERGYGWGPGWGPGRGYGPGGWDRPTGSGGAGGESDSPGDPREAWIRGRLDEWHRTAHATADRPGGAGNPPTGPTGTAPGGPTEPRPAG